MASLGDAIQRLERGDWQGAHRIVQDAPGELAAWAHGIVHMLEGDRANAGYWYRRARRNLPGADALDAEIAALKAAAGSGGS